MPRNRTARLAVLNSVQRAATTQYSSRSGSAVKRRAVASVLVVLSLVLITVYFRESSSGGLHGVQNAGSTVLRPFEVVAERVARPFRDAYGYFSGLAHAKSEAARLRKENAALQQQLATNAVTAAELRRLRAMLDYRARPSYPDGFRTVATEVISQPPDEFDQQIVIGAGKSSGFKAGAPVLDPRGHLVGTVSLAFRDTARVTLLTDETSHVTGLDYRTKASGIVSAQGQGGTLTLDRVSKDQVVKRGDTIVTQGWKYRGLSSLYPPGILVGRVTNVGQLDIEPYQRIQLETFADLDSLDSVQVLVEKEPAALR